MGTAPRLLCWRRLAPALPDDVIAFDISSTMRTLRRPSQAALSFWLDHRLLVIRQGNPIESQWS